MKGSLKEFSREEIQRNTSACVTVDNYFNHDWHEAKRLYASVAKWYENEREFDVAKKDYLRKQSA